MILVSINILAYNHETTIARALDSVLSQNVNFDYEIIIAEDCSTDNTKEIIMQYASKYDCIKPIYNVENQGMKRNSIIARSNCNGKYIAYLEGDDYWVSNQKLQKQIDFLEKNNEYVASYHNVKSFDVINGEKRKNNFYPIVGCHDYTIENARRFQLAGQTASLVHRNFFKKMNVKELAEFDNCDSNPDMKLSIILPYYGKVRYFYDVWAIHPRYFDTDSWTSKTNDKNIYYYYYQSMVNIAKYIKSSFHDDLYTNEYTDNLIIGSLIYFFKTRNKNDYDIFHKIKYEAKYTNIDIIKALLIKILRKIKKVYKKR